jgi:hypothetical protein
MHGATIKIKMDVDVSALDIRPDADMYYENTVLNKLLDLLHGMQRTIFIPNHMGLHATIISR